MQTGFSLVEMIVVITISTGLVFLLVKLYQSVAHAGQIVGSRQSDWGAERFMRKQMLVSLVRANSRGYFTGETDRLMFATRKSAAGSMEGWPVLAYYAFEPNARALTYRESPLLPDGQEATAPSPARQWQDFRLQTTPPAVILHGVENLRFGYHGPLSTQKWQGAWNDPEPPTLVRVEYTKAGQEHVVLLEPAVFYSDVAIPAER